MVLYTNIYINPDDLSLEILGYERNKKKAIDELIRAAHYEEIDNILYQYRRPTSDYRNLIELRWLVNKYNVIYDNDVYYIMESEDQ